MQSLSGKLAALSRFLSRLAEKSLPFFETLKNITKENRDDYRCRITGGSQRGAASLTKRKPMSSKLHGEEEWVLDTDGASSIKGSEVRLVLISPTKTEYTYALRLNFTSTNNQAEYEALLA
ncbi:hypothetical protein Tco_0082061, partial [Tanacetum coccineum]